MTMPIRQRFPLRASPSPGPGRSAPGTGSVVGFLVMLEFASGILQGWLPPLLPGIVAQYGVTAAEANWVSAVYLLSSAVCVPLMSRLGDRFGHRRLLVAAAALVAVGSVLVAVAPTFGVLLVGRVVQGPLGAFLALEFAIVRERAGDRAPRAIGLLVGALAIGGSLGLLLAGVARQYLSLPATLWIAAVIMIAAVPVAALLVPETTARAPRRTDRAGVAHPLVDLASVLRGGLGLPVPAGFLIGAELFGSQAASVLFLGLPRSSGFGLGLTPGRLGLVLLAFGAAAFVGTWLAPGLAERIGARPTMVLGSGAIAAGYLLTALLHGTVGGVTAWQVLVGVGNGLVLAALSTHVVTRSPADAVGLHSGLFTTARTVGGAVSGAAFAAVMGAVLIRVPGLPSPTTAEAGYVTVWLICAALGVAVGGLALRMGLAPGELSPSARRTGAG